MNYDKKYNLLVNALLCYHHSALSCWKGDTYSIIVAYVFSKCRKMRAHQWSQLSSLSCKSTVTNLLECLNDWTYNFDHHISTHVVYLDYSKCFDKVCHSKLLYKLSQYGITGSAYMWFKNFLTNRVQSVKVNNSFSSQVHVLSGVWVWAPYCFYCTLQTYPVLWVIVQSVCLLTTQGL